MPDPGHHVQTPSGLPDLMQQVYDELRRLARAHLGPDRGRQTLQATALVHEAYLKLNGQSKLDHLSREEFFRLAARVMRNVFVDHVRASQAEKRGGGWQRVSLGVASDSGSPDELDVLALDEAIEELSRLNEEKARLVELRFFGGMTETEAADALGISRTHATRQWRLARAWLQNRLRDKDERL